MRVEQISDESIEVCDHGCDGMGGTHTSLPAGSEHGTLDMVHMEHEEMYYLHWSACDGCDGCSELCGNKGAICWATPETWCGKDLLVNLSCEYIEEAGGRQNAFMAVRAGV